MAQADPLTDDEFLSAFADCDLPPTAFDHRGHLRLAWIQLRRLPLDAAIEQVCGGIARFAAHLGASGKFNRTLTEALVRVIARRVAADESLSWPEFLDANDDLVSHARAVLDRHYSPERLASEAARRGFIAPDREALSP